MYLAALHWTHISLAYNVINVKRQNFWRTKSQNCWYQEYEEWKKKTTERCTPRAKNMVATAIETKKKHGNNCRNNHKTLVNRTLLYNTYRCFHLYSLFLTIAKLKHDKDFYDSLDCMRTYVSKYVSANQMCIILKSANISKQKPSHSSTIIHRIEWNKQTNRQTNR